MAENIESNIPVDGSNQLVEEHKCSGECIKAEVYKIHPEPGDVIILRFHPDITDWELQMMVDQLKEEFPDNKVLAILNDMQILCEEREAAISLLNNMIAHIRIEGSEKPKIIL